MTDGRAMIDQLRSLYFLSHSRIAPSIYPHARHFVSHSFIYLDDI